MYLDFAQYLRIEGLDRRVFFAMSETVHLGACVVISYIINLFLEVVWPTSESAGLEVTG